MSLLTSSRDLWALISELKGKVTIVLTTHYMEEAETLCDRILMLHEGQIIAEGTPDTLKQQTDASNLRDVFIHFAKKRGVLA